MTSAFASTLYSRFRSDSECRDALIRYARRALYACVAIAVVLTFAARIFATIGHTAVFRLYLALIASLAGFAVASKALSFIRRRQGDGRSYKFPRSLVAAVLSLVQCVGIVAVATANPLPRGGAKDAAAEGRDTTGDDMRPDFFSYVVSVIDLVTFTALLLTVIASIIRSRSSSAGGGSPDPRAYALAATQELDYDGASASARRGGSSSGSGRVVSASMGATNAGGDGLDDDDEDWDGDLDLDAVPSPSSGLGGYNHHGHASQHEHFHFSNGASAGAGGSSSSQFLGSVRQYGFLGGSSKKTTARVTPASGARASPVSGSGAVGSSAAAGARGTGALLVPPPPGAGLHS